MEWYIMNGAGLRAITTELVIQVGDDEWEVCADAAEKLEELCEKLYNEDDNTMAVRRELALSDIIRSQLVIVVRICSCERLDVMYLALKALSKLTNPMYLLLTPQDGGTRESENNALFEDLHRIVVDFQESLTDETVMSKIIKHMEMLLEDSGDEEACVAINNGLLVFRNLLTVRADTNQWTNEQAHNRIVCSLLNNNFGTLLVNMLLNQNMSKWYLSIAQLISLIFMSQNERDFTLFVLRDDRAKRNCENSLSENGSSQTSPLSFTESSNGSGSEGDTESTAFRCLTAMQRGHPNNQLITRDSLPGPRQAFLKNGVPIKLKRRLEDVDAETNTLRRSKELHLDEHTDPASTPSSVGLMDGVQCSLTSTMSVMVSEDDASARAVSSGESSSRCSPALSKSGCSSQEVDSGQAPSPSQISLEVARGPQIKITVTLMREIREKLLLFTHDLMRSTAVSKLCLCLQENMLTVDKTLAHTIENYLLWLTGLFTKFGTLKNAGWESVSNILSPQLFSYLTYRCTRLMMQVLQTEGNNQQLYLAYIRRLYLACRALHSAIQVVEFFIYKKKHMNKTAAVELTCVQSYLLHCRDLRQFFLLAIRNFRPEFMSRLFLNEIIMCNHRYLLVVEELTSQPTYNGPLKMLDHVRQFATLSTMRQYALALDTFETNDKTLNECIFTLMYHVAGDCQQPEVLFQLPLMGLFTKIIESSTAISQDAMNMIEYVMDRFLELAHLSPELCANFLYTANMAAAETSVLQLQKQQIRQEADEKDMSTKQVQKEEMTNILSEKFKSKVEKVEVEEKICVKVEPISIMENKECSVKKEVTENEEVEKKMSEFKEWSYDERNLLISAYFTRCSSMSKGKYVSEQVKGRWLDDIVAELSDQGVDRTRYQVTAELSLLGLLKDSTKCETNESTIEPDDEQGERRYSWLDGISTDDLFEFVRQSEGGKPAIEWVQQFILEVLYCRLGGKKAWQAMTEFPHPALRFHSGWTHEDPIVVHHMSRAHDIPLIAASEEEERRLCDPYFREILRRSGFQLPSQPHRIFPVFPHQAGDVPDSLLELLKSLGELPTSSKFSLQDMVALASQKTSFTSSCTSEKSSSAGNSNEISSCPKTIPSNMWMKIVSLHNQKESGCVK